MEVLWQIRYLFLAEAAKDCGMTWTINHKTSDQWLVSQSISQPIMGGIMLCQSAILGGSGRWLRLLAASADPAVGAPCMYVAVLLAK